MKKLLILLLGVFFCYPLIYAQTDIEHRLDSLENELNRMNIEKQKEDLNRRVWGKGRFLRIGYANAQTANETNPVEKSKYSFFLTKGTTYYLFPSKPIAGMIKFGIDATWFDIQYSKFKSLDESGDWTSEIPSGGSNDDDFDLDFNLGTMALGFGMGVGPSVTVAPFIRMKKALQPLRATLYFHYVPTLEMFMESNDEDTELSSAFCNMFKFGGEIHYRKIGLGIEGRWGASDFNPTYFDEELDRGDSSKYKRKFASTRFYVQFTF